MNESVSRRAILGGVAVVAAAGRNAVSAQVDPAQIPGKILFVRNGAVWVWSGNNASELISADNISDPRWSPDGNALIYVRTYNSYSDLYTYDLTSGVETQLTFNEPPYDLGSLEYAQYSSWVLDPDWAQTGLIGFVSDMVGSGGYLMLWLMSSVLEAPYLALAPGDEDDISGLALAPNSNFASYTVRVRMGDASSETYVALRDLDSGIAGPIALSSNDIFDSAVSPDGEWVAVTIRDDAGMTDIWMVERATGDRSRGTRSQNALAPRWSANGEWFGYIRMDDFTFEIWAGRFVKGRIRDAVKIYDEGGIDAQSGLSWWTGSDIATPE